MIKQIIALLSPTFWCQALASLRFFLFNNVRAIQDLGLRGQKTDISPSARFGYPQNIYIGNNCSINHGVHLYAGPNTTLTIDDDTLLGPGVFITTDSFSESKYNMTAAHSGHEASIKIGRNVRIGAHAIILPGVTIGDGASVGAGSIVTKDIPPRVIAAGNPARVIKTIE
ncbi:MAG: sugar O-acetyltransferase [FCB group bacterium]|nr:sugar O-acetyltransferase [FCB group bacterium]